MHMSSETLDRFNLRPGVLQILCSRASDLRRSKTRSGSVRRTAGRRDPFVLHPVSDRILEHAIISQYAICTMAERR